LFRDAKRPYYEPIPSWCAAKNVTLGKKVATGKTRIFDNLSASVFHLCFIRGRILFAAEGRAR
jgi:hypothetical protein